MSLSLEASGFRLEITVELIKNLNLHEEIIQDNLFELVETIKEEREIRDPVIADKKSKVVLDGMHRVGAISYLGYDKIPVCFVDYNDPKIKLGSWCRAYERLSLEEILEICEDLNVEVEKCELEKAIGAIEGRVKKLFFVSESECYSISSDISDMKELLELAEDMEEALEEHGFKAELVSDKNIMEKAKSGRVLFLIPPAEKEEVIEVSNSKSVFSHKMTRHVIPARPMNIDVSLDLLKENVRSADEKITEKLKNREREHLPPGSFFGGRKYEEELIVFRNSV